MGDVALIVGGGPGISASCARLFSASGMQVAIAARNIDKPVLRDLEATQGVSLHSCDAADPEQVEALFTQVKNTLGVPRLVVHNIDGRVREIFRQPITDAPAGAVLATLTNSTFSAFLVGQQAARLMLGNDMKENGRGTIIYTNASAAIKGYPHSGAFAAASHGKAGLAESMARELMPQGLHIVNVPIDGAIAPERDDGPRAHWLAGESKDDNMLHPDEIARAYLQLHQQHRSGWTHEVVLRPWVENW